MTPLALLDPDTAFGWANTIALLAWIALALSPASARWTPWVWRITGRALPVFFGGVYVALLALHWRGEGGFNSLDEVRAMFAVPGALTAGWVHYLAFDLFVGTWIAERSVQLGLGHAWVIPLLLMTFLFGPLGLLAFVLVRALRRPLKWQPGVPT
ncbi:MAG TPA: ABA4-like family protein [Hydrogenophaga sp.]|nr:ABA4-like family protein [Hydrogenophaga sp.]